MNEENQMKLIGRSGSEDGSVSKGMNPFFDGLEEESSVILRRIREKSGYSNYQFAEQSGVDRPYLNRLEYGTKANLSIRTVVNIAWGLVRLSVDVLESYRFLVGAGGLPIFLFARVPSSVLAKITSLGNARQQHVNRT